MYKLIEWILTIITSVILVFVFDHFQWFGASDLAVVFMSQASIICCYCLSVLIVTASAGDDYE